MFTLPLTAEIRDANTAADARRALDAFREAVRPNDYGITLAARDDDESDQLCSVCQCLMWQCRHDGRPLLAWNDVDLERATRTGLVAWLRWNDPSREYTTEETYSTGEPAPDTDAYRTTAIAQWNEYRVAALGQLENLRAIIDAAHQIRALFVDGNEWIEELSGADVIQDVTNILSAAGLGPDDVSIDASDGATSDIKVTCPACDAKVNDSDMRKFRGARMCVWCKDEAKRAERSRS